MLARLLVLAAALRSVGATSGTDLEPLIEDYLKKVYAVGDNDQNGKIACASEFSVVLTELELVDTFSSSDCTGADTAPYGNGDGEITEAEFAEYAINEVEKSKFDVMTEKITGVSTDLSALTEGIGEVNPEIKKAEKAVEIVMESSLNLEDLLPAQKTRIKRNFESLLQLVQDDPRLFLKFLGGSMVVSGKAFYASEADASAAKANAATQLPDAATASTYMGIPVTSKPDVKESAVAGKHDIQYSIVGAVGGVTLVLAIAAGCIARYIAKKKAGRSGPCCSVGCCSAYALKGWAIDTILGVLFLIAGAVLIYLAMRETKEDLKCIVDTAKDLTEVNVTDIKDSLGELPLNRIDPFRQYIDYLDVFAIVPAVLAILFLLIASACAFRNIPTMKCAKFFIFLGYIFLLLSIAFYAIFAAVSVATQFDVVRDILKLVTSICENTIPAVEEKLAFANATLTRGLQVGASIGDYKTTFDTYAPVVPKLKQLCSCVDELLLSFAELFVPGIVCMLAIIYLYFSSIGLCCSAKCCAAPGVLTTKTVEGEVTQEV